MTDKPDGKRSAGNGWASILRKTALCFSGVVALTVVGLLGHQRSQQIAGIVGCMVASVALAFWIQIDRKR
jgi:hypothetical protein